jgi:redox-sensitive bicupin YhaK (pirin superfamily)
MIREIKTYYKCSPTIEGVNVHLKWAFGFSQPEMFDPVLLLDDFHSNNPDAYIRGFHGTPAGE